MAPDRRMRVLVGVLTVLLVGVAARYWLQWQASAPAARGVTGTAARRPSGSGPVEAPEVHLKALEAEHPRPGEAERNLFRFKPKPPPPPPPSAARANAPPQPTVPAPPPGPPPPPPIPIKFLGIVEAPGRAQKLAVLSDGRGGAPFSGKEGDIIEGRYRILRIGAESIEMVYLDGRGRQVIRQSGS